MPTAPPVPVTVNCSTVTVDVQVYPHDEECDGEDERNYGDPDDLDAILLQLGVAEDQYCGFDDADPDD